MAYSVTYSGTSWEGVGWKRQLVPQRECSRSFRLAVQDADKRTTTMALVALLPFIAVLMIALAASPAAAGSCYSDVVAPRLRPPVAQGIATCYSAGDHRHYLWVKLKKDTYGYPNATAASAGRWSSKSRFLDRVSGWLGPGWYYTYTGVRYQDSATYRSVYSSSRSGVGAGEGQNAVVGNGSNYGRTL